MQAMLTVTPLQMLGLWEDLLDAQAGINRYAGDVAEIYLFRLMPSSPLAALDPTSPQVEAAYRTAGKALHEFCKLFAERRDVHVEFEDGSPLERLLGPETFTHRVHLRVLG